MDLNKLYFVKKCLISSDCTMSTKMDLMEHRKHDMESQTSVMESYSDIMESSSTMEYQTGETEHLEYLESLQLYSCNPTTTTSTTVAMTTAVTTMMTTEESMTTPMTLSNMEDSSTMTNESMTVDGRMSSDDVTIRTNEESSDMNDDVKLMPETSSTIMTNTQNDKTSRLSNSTMLSMDSTILTNKEMSTTPTTLSSTLKPTTKMSTTTMTTSTTTKPRRVTTPKQKEKVRVWKICLIFNCYPLLLLLIFSEIKQKILVVKLQTQPPAQAARQNSESEYMLKKSFLSNFNTPGSIEMIILC